MPHADIVIRAYSSQCPTRPAGQGRNGAQVPSAAVPVPASVPGADLAGAPPDELPPGIDSGLLLHDLLENADLELARRTPGVAAWATDPSVTAMIVDHARERGIAPMFHAHAARLVHRALV